MTRCTPAFVPEPESPQRVAAAARAEATGTSTSSPRPAESRTHFWYVFDRWLETPDLDDGFVLA